MYHNTSECITIWHACSKPPKIDHAKRFYLSMCNLFFFIIKFLFPCPLVCKPLRKHALPDQTHSGFLFNLIRNPCGYQYIGTSPFPDSFRFAKSRTNPKHHRAWKIQTSSTKYWSRSRLYSILGTPSWNNYFFCCLQKKKKHL